MPDGMQRGGPGRAPHSGARGSYPRAGYNVRGKRFPRFFFSLIYHGAPYNRRDNMERPGRDGLGRRDSDYYGKSFSGTHDSRRRPAPAARNAAQHYGRYFGWDH